MLVAGMKMGQQKATQQAQAQSQQKAAVENAKQQGADEAQAKMTASAAAPAAGGMHDATIAQLKQLAELHTSGVLSDEEFSAAKKKILG
jgi:transcription initiation factor TFIID subunit TAF12